MNLNFCPECAAPLRKDSDSEYTCRNGHKYWNNPRATVGIFLIKDGQVLFAKRGEEPHKGKYDIIGGFMNFGEDAHDAARRELQEETGLTVNSLELLDIVTHLYSQDLSLCAVLYASRDWSGTPVPQDDVAALEWHSPELINSPDFAWRLPGLAQKLQAYVDR